MNRREKILAIVIGAMVAGYAGYGAVNKLLFGRAAAYDAEAASLRADLNKLRAENRRKKGYVARLQGFASRSFEGDEVLVRERMRARLIRLLEHSGLSTEKLVSQPLQGRRLKHKGKEKDRSVGRSVTIRGKPSHVINFLYLLKKDPYVHRIEGITLSADPKTGKMDLQLKYFTLLLDGVKREAPASSPATSPAGGLDGPDRDGYDLIVRRDVFRPYVRRPTRVATRSPQRPRRAYPRPRVQISTPAPPPGPQKRLRVTGLSTLSGVPEVSVRNRSDGEVKTYKLGESLGNGTIVMIDYRPMPKPEDPRDLSGSRVILRIGGNYWAVEIGQYLVDKYRLKALELPPGLRGRAGAAGESSEKT